MSGQTLVIVRKQTIKNAQNENRTNKVANRRDGFTMGTVSDAKKETRAKVLL